MIKELRFEVIFDCIIYHLYASFETFVHISQVRMKYEPFERRFKNSLIIRVVDPQTRGWLLIRECRLDLCVQR